MKAKTSLEEKFIALLDSILEYGASAQTYFETNDILVTSGMSSVSVTDGVLNDGFTSGKYLNGTTLTITADQKADATLINWKKIEGGAETLLPATDTLEIVVSDNVEYVAVYGGKASEGLVFTSNGDKTCYVSRIGTCKDTDIIIPSVSPDGDKVISIGNSAFSSCSNLTSVTIPDSVTSIGNYAFYGCSSLTSITIPDSVTSIGNYAFYGCSSLTSVTIPDSVTNIGNSAFDDCSSLTSVTIPDSVTNIGNSAFRNCSKLTTITVADGNSKYHSAGNCLIETETKTLIAGCNTSVIPTDGSVTSIGAGAFCRLTLTSITIPNSVTSIGYDAFRECSSLTSVTIPSSVTSIGDAAFYSCKGLTGALVIPEGVTSIGDLAFIDCSGLTGELIIPGSVTSIGDVAFSGCSGITSVTISDGVTSIGSGMFSGCSSLTSITIPDSVTSIGNSAFYNCTGLTSITIGNSVTSIGQRAFYNCTGLIEINFNATKCQDLTAGFPTFESAGINGSGITVTFGNNVQYIPANLFRRASTNIKSVIIGNSVTSIGSFAFLGCSELTSITIPNSVTSIGSSAFHGCFELTSITIPDSVTSIGGSAFYWCTKLTSVTIPSSVTSIGASAFYNCSGLTNIVLSEGVTSIGGSAFYYCSELKTVYFTGTEEQWNQVTIGSSNSYLTDATRYYYSEDPPTDEGNYWHYVDGVPTVWNSTEE